MERSSFDYETPEAGLLRFEYEYAAAYSGNQDCPPEDAAVSVIGANVGSDKFNILPFLEAFGFDVDQLAERILSIHESQMMPDPDDQRDAAIEASKFTFDGGEGRLMPKSKG